MKTLWIAVIVVGIIAIGGYVFPNATGLVGGITNYDTISVNGLVIGSGCNNFGATCYGTTLGGVVSGSCTIWDDANTIAASTTGQVECQAATNGTLSATLQGITSDAHCVLTMASSTNTVSNGLVLGGASASSTANGTTIGSIVGQISNLTGGTFTWSAAASSSNKWKYTCIDPA